MSSKRFETLQFVRFLSALGVIFAHVELYEFHSTHAPLDLFSLGACGVDVFFVISGFVMVHVLQGVPRNSLTAAQFFVRRMARIVPLYFAFTVVVIIGSWLVSKTQSPHNLSFTRFFSPGKLNWDIIEQSITFRRWDMQPVYEVGWTLQYEFWFYVLVTLMIATRINVYAFFAAYTAVIVAAARLVPFPRMNPVEFMLLDPLMLEFAFGAVLYQIFERSKRFHGSAWLSASLLSAAGFLFFSYSDPYMLDAVGVYSRALLWGGGAFFFVFFFLQLEGKFRPQRAFIYLGNASYSIYLTHWIVLAISQFLFWRAGWFPSGSISVYVYTSVAITLFASLATYRFVEKPLGKWLSDLLDSVFSVTPASQNRSARTD